MKGLVISALAVAAINVMVIETHAQYSGIPDGKRVIIKQKDSHTDVYPMNNITDMTLVVISDAKVTLGVLEADDASIRISAEMADGCKSFKSVCYPASSLIDSDKLEEYIMQDPSAILSKNGVIEYIDLKPETTYTVSVLAFDEFDLPCDITSVTVSTTSNSGIQEPVEIGSYLYADGTWSKTLKTNKTPVAVIFSTQTSEQDRKAGYYHGYAIAFKGIEGDAWTIEADEMESGSYISTSADADLKDLDGRIHTDHLLQKSALHPAAAAASSYGEAPDGTSGWYLPSSGQMVDLFKNLGDLSNDSFYRQSNGSASWNPEAASSALAKINAKLAKIGDDKYQPIGTYTWTSSEASVMSAFYLYSHPSAGLMLQTYYKDSKFDIRPVLAF